MQLLHFKEDGKIFAAVCIVLEHLVPTSERNREMAKKSRLKKKFEVSALEQLYADLVADNEAIKAYLRQFPEELISSDGVSIKTKASQEEIPSATAMLQHDIELPDELTRIAAKMMSNTFNGSLGGASSQYASSGSLNDMAEAMHIDPATQQSVLPPDTVDTDEVPLLVVNSMNPEYPIVYASPAFMMLTGYAVEELIGRNCGSFLQCPTSDPIEVSLIQPLENPC